VTYGTKAQLYFTLPVRPRISKLEPEDAYTLSIYLDRCYIRYNGLKSLTATLCRADYFASPSAYNPYSIIFVQVSDVLFLASNCRHESRQLPLYPRWLGELNRFFGIAFWFFYILNLYGIIYSFIDSIWSPFYWRNLLDCYSPKLRVALSDIYCTILLKFDSFMYRNVLPPCFVP